MAATKSVKVKFTVEQTNPSHYRDFGEYSALHIVKEWGLGFCLGNSLKYIQRAGYKTGETEQVALKKAIWYILRHLHEIDPENNPDPAAEENRGVSWYTP